MKLLRQLIARLGALLLIPGNVFGRGLRETGQIILFGTHSLGFALRGQVRARLTFEQMQFIGTKSLFIIVLTGAFTGMVFALQVGRAFAMFRAEGLTGAVASIALGRELAPVLSALMVTARAVSAMAAQIGTMRVTQQIDALEAMAVNPINYLATPRILATFLILPLLCAVFDLVGGVGCYLIGVKLLHIPEGIFMDSIEFYVETADMVQGLFKSSIFALIISTIGCYKGYRARGGAVGVGQATTEAVVLASVMVLVANYFITAIFF